MASNKKMKFPMPFFIRQLFSVIGFLFTILFTIRGICQAVLTYKNYSEEISSAFSAKDIANGLSIIINNLKHPYIPVLDLCLTVLCILVMVHGVIGCYYAITTEYSLKRMFKEKGWFYLQILSTFGAVYVIIAILRPMSEMKTHSLVFWLVTILIAFIGAFHIANGFYNASITMGISVSHKTKLTFRILAWIVAIISVLQILVYFI